MNVCKLEIKSSEILMADIVLGQYGSKLSALYNSESESCFKASPKSLNSVITIKKNFHEIELVDAWKWILKTKYWNSADITG